MNFIDQKGRVKIFKWKINIIDLTILIFLFSVLIAGVLGINILTKFRNKTRTKPIYICEVVEHNGIAEEVKTLRSNIHKMEYENKDLRRLVEIMHNQQENFLKEHKRARRYFR